MTRPAQPLPPQFGDRPFHVREALLAGVTRGSLLRDSLRVPTWGVRAPAAASDALVDQCHAYVPALHPQYAFSHVTALRLLGIEVPWTLEDDKRVHAVLPRRGERPQRPELHAHFCGRDGLSVVELDGLRVTSPAQTWIHLAADLDEDGLVVLGDSLLRRKAAMTTPTALRSLLGRFPGARGVRRARAALELIRPGTDSSMETRARLLLVRAGLPCPAVNGPARGVDGEFLALPDMSYPELKIAIEYDGDIHRTDPDTWRRDVERRQRLQENRWLIITVTADDVIREQERFVRRVASARAARSRLVERVGHL